MSARKKLTAEVNQPVEEKMLEKISTFLTTNKKPLLIGLAVVVLVVAAVLVTLAVINNNKAEALLEIDALETRYEEIIQADTTADGYSEKLETLKTDLAGLADKGGSSYPVIKADYLLGSLEAESTNWKEAEAYFQKAFDDGQNLYLAPLALLNVGVAQEEQGNSDAALLTYAKIWDTYNTTSPVGAKALFSEGRIYDVQGDNELAKATFYQLIDNFPSSDYSKLAKNKVITL